MDSLCKDIEAATENKAYWFKVSDDGAFAGGIGKFAQLKHAELTEKLSALGAEMDIAIRMQREDIFNAMHKI